MPMPVLYHIYLGRKEAAGRDPEALQSHRYTTEFCHLHNRSIPPHVTGHAILDNLLDILDNTLDIREHTRCHPIHTG